MCTSALKLVSRVLAIVSCSTIALAQTLAQTPGQLFDQRCATCHGSGTNERAPDPSVLRRMAPEQIYAALTTGVMQAAADGLTDAQKRALAEYLPERRLVTDSAAVSAMPNRCTSRPPINPAAPSWNGWGIDAGNSRFQPARASGLSVEQAPSLKLKWAFGFPGASSVYGQPTLFGGRVFIGVDTGYVYALDAASGCVLWSYQARAGVRNAISVAAAADRQGRFNAYFGDLRANVYAVDADSGELIWTVHVDDHGLARVTGTPKLHDGRLYVPVASGEEGTAGNPLYQCCTFRGSLVALDATTGRQIWKTYTIAEPPKPTRRNSRGTQQWGPAGGAIWSSPTIDERRGLIYVATGNAYAPPAPRTTDALIAFDLRSGAIRWVAQATEADAWIVGCGPTPIQQASLPPGTPPAERSENCPDDLGPDHDFAESPMLVRVGGREMIITAQKSGMIAARDPERQGALIWQHNAADRPIGPQAEIAWGGANDGARAYFGLNGGAAIAVQLATGTPQWRRPLPRAIPQAVGGNNTAVTVAGSLVLLGG
jgi:polyvinyl alcohol dehydrogenase (cytochrome)